MNKSAKKKPAKKRAYKKRTVTENTDSSGWVPPIKKTVIDTELESLAKICSIMDNWDDDQKTRNIRFLASKYWNYLNTTGL